MINLDSGNDLLSHLVELSSKSFDLLASEQYVTSSGIYARGRLEPSPDSCSKPDLTKLRKITPVKDGTNIIAVDASCRSIAEYHSGLIAAYRGTIAWTENGCYRFLRCGPFILTISALAGQISGGIPYPIKLESLSLEAQMIAVQSIIERELQTYACANSSESVILLDGCLATASLERPNAHLERLLDKARCNGNAVVAISKKSRLCTVASQLQRSLATVRFPFVIELTELAQATGFGLRLLGRVFTGRLAADGNLFRIDIDEKLEEERRDLALGQLLGNDIVQRGYPETLRLAHILSIFTSPEVIAMQRLVANRLGLRSGRGPNLRRQLFGPFGKWNDS